jgi:hypothetical protein
MGTGYQIFYQEMNVKMMLEAYSLVLVTFLIINYFNNFQLISFTSFIHHVTRLLVKDLALLTFLFEHICM